MSDLFSSALGAVGQVGDAIDKVTGGRAVRGTLAGKPRELASIIPFSDTIGLTNAADSTSGRGLLDHYGFTNPNSHSFGSGAAGFVADNVLSPANWIGAGSAFKAAPTIAKGLARGAASLTGLDSVQSVGRGVNYLGKKVGSIPFPSVAKYGKNADLVDAYADISKNFPKPVPIETYKPPAGLLESHLGATPDSALLAAERRSNNAIDAFQGKDRRVVPDDHFYHQTTVPGGVGGTEFGGRFSNPVPVPHYQVPEASSIPGSKDDLESQLAAMGWGAEEPRGLGRIAPAIIQKPGLFGVQSSKKTGPGVANALGRNREQSLFNTSTNGIELPHERAVRIGNENGAPTVRSTAQDARVQALLAGYNSEAMKQVPGWYNVGEGHISLNPHYPGWNNEDIMNKMLLDHGPAGSKWFSADNPDHIINHEIGHSWHADSVGDKFIDDPSVIGSIDNPVQSDYIARNLSGYGATRKEEAIAELVAAIKGGRTLPKSVFTGMIKNWGGQGLYQRLGDNGLLKGFGLGALGMIGLGESQQEPGG